MGVTCKIAGLDPKLGKTRKGKSYNNKALARVDNDMVIKQKKKQKEKEKKEEAIVKNLLNTIQGCKKVLSS